ncbi:gluconate 2-dehydrogenase gamma chain [Paracoccus lutimaris]|uniref:Gluconate 2-dehydrogenase gamma chain n=2 Tax=Paracoccus lutimaris TaxID=1490030 RepID=A0A368Z7G5_9RHOB|nr:gluconate 2-dehydrogenase gamma chain [Paracoccus lutimaris]
MKSRRMTRRGLLTTAAGAALLLGFGKVSAQESRPVWMPFDGFPPADSMAEGLQFLTPDEARTVGAIVERLIPADALSPSGKDAGCVDFIDRQLSGPYGVFSGQYREGPFQDGTPMQGDQSPLDARQRYRLGLAALDGWCRANAQAAFADLPEDRRDAILADLETGKITLDGIPAELFFEQVLANTMEGFFADPIHGGNKDMVSWRMLGFPGARYDYLDSLDIAGTPLRLDPIGLKGGPSWSADWVPPSAPARKG